MIVCRNLDNTDIIRTIDEWFEKCPPQGKEQHWVDGRSTKETAKYWTRGQLNEFHNLFSPMILKINLASPEYISNFDNYGGGSHLDLIIKAIYLLDEVVIVGIESKVDEQFGTHTIREHRNQGNPNSEIPKRIDELKQSLFINQQYEGIEDLRYQLLTGTAGTLAEAKRQKVNKAYFIVQTFISQNMDSEKHRHNQRELDKYLEIISNGKYKIIHDGDLLLIGKLPGNKYIPNDVDLYIGKYSIKI